MNAIEELEGDNDRLLDELADLRNTLAERADEIARLEEELEEKDFEIRELEMSIREMEEKVDDTDEMNALLSDLLEEIHVADLHNHPKSVQALWELASRK